jgi:putative redox protein
MSEIIAKIDNSKYKTRITNHRHDIIADEPIPFGTDTGPTPYDYLLSALGSCVAITIRMYADRKNWPLEEVEVHLTQNRVHHTDCSDCKSKKGFIHIIQKEIKLVGDLDEKQRDRLMEIADRCPVNKTLLNEIVIKTKELAS